MIAKLLYSARQAELDARDDRWDLLSAAPNGLPLRSAGTIFGIPVHIIPDDIARVTRPARAHRDRGKVIGHRLFSNGYVRKPSPYHLRIQKKWNKRYGFITENRVYFMREPRERMMVMGESHYAAIIEQAKLDGLL